MASNEEITAQDLIEALRQANEPDTPDRPPNTLRMEEILDVLNIGRKRGLRLVRELKDSGLVEVVQIPYTNLVGHTTMIPAYRLKEETDD